MSLLPSSVQRFVGTPLDDLRPLAYTLCYVPQGNRIDALNISKMYLELDQVEHSELYVVDPTLSSTDRDARLAEIKARTTANQREVIALEATKKLANQRSEACEIHIGHIYRCRLPRQVPLLQVNPAIPFSHRRSDLITMSGRSRSGLCNIFLHMLDHIYSNFAEIIFLDRDRISKLHEFSQAVVAKGAKVHNVWAFIDGTVRECRRPEGNERQRTVYNGHKRRHTVKYQTLVNPDGIIAHAFGPIEGRRHDLIILRHSNLENVIARDARFQVFVVFGDPAYGYPDQLASHLVEHV
ncbi:hypothetical protein H257_03281 [Aphanomyces astaci]|uniref:DDE Tnp4 domain-containing protein n=1 Tax=Aphanomyces astaci TaxID=112090 RepID=W4H362_APHAT|nr:hypothetical protein H257_03281 [Aphanomyces astaci]ETV85573.1 hypothetical protein H257_03281 [Aphanomyces astaci]|eukprot:XP_009825591.1 hypothetical protein H257_03281 [Aphanomyces astaci]